MKITYDKTVDAAYIYLMEDEKIDHNTTVDGLDGMLNIDFSSSGKLVGIELIPGSKFLNKETLDSAEIIG